MSYDAVLFDNDGVITELTERTVLRDAVRAAFTEHGVDDPREDHVDELLAGVSVDWLHDVCGGYDLDPDAFWRRRDHHASRLQCREIREGRKPLYDDAAALLDGLDRPAGIVSSNQQTTIDFIVDHYDLGDVFDTHYGREESLDGIRRKKPETHYLDLAMADLGVDSALYVGDSGSDVVAAHRAGLDSAFVRRPHREGYALPEEPTHEVAGLDEVGALL